MTYIMMSAEELILAADALDLLDAEAAEPLAARLRARHAELMDAATQARWEAYREGVANLEEGTLEMDIGALVSEGGDGGAYVMTWSWVTNGEADLCEKCSGSLDDGEGYDGLCGDCADKAESGYED